jgi:hypothetical protein
MLLSPDGESGLLQGYKPIKTKKNILSSYVFSKIESLDKSTTVRNRMFKMNTDEHTKISNTYIACMADFR